MNSKVVRLARSNMHAELALLIGRDYEADHEKAEAVLLAYLRLIGEKEVADSYEKTKRRCNFQYQ